jgi:endonuclease YncB( thermonuclease family)
MKWWVVGIIGILMVTGVIVFKKEKLYTVSRVIDGDTMVIDNNQEVRLANIDAPEKGRCGFDEAKETLTKMVVNKKIKVEGKTNDKFGRLLVLAWMGGKLINEKMVRTGWVRYISQGENKYLSEVDDEAEKAKLGIYGLCVETTNTKQPNCLIKGNNREGTDDHIYLLPGCKGYTNTVIATDQGDSWFCNETEAIAAGYVKALNCN